MMYDGNLKRDQEEKSLVVTFNECVVANNSSTRSRWTFLVCINKSRALSTLFSRVSHFVVFTKVVIFCNNIISDVNLQYIGTSRSAYARIAYSSLKHSIQ